MGGHEILSLGIDGFRLRGSVSRRAPGGRCSAVFDAIPAAAPTRICTGSIADYRASTKARISATSKSPSCWLRSHPTWAPSLRKLFGVEDVRQVGHRAHASRLPGAVHLQARRRRQGGREVQEPRIRTDWDLDKVASDLELLKRTTSPEGVEDRDDECATSVVAARLANLAGHYQKLAKGKPGEVEDADAAGRGAARAPESECTGRADLRRRESHCGLLWNSSPIYWDTWNAGPYAAIKDPVTGDPCRGLGRIPRTLPRTELLTARALRYAQQRGGELNSLTTSEEERRRRDGFRTHRQTLQRTRSLVSKSITASFCHDRDRDSCSKGMRHKNGELHVNPLGVTLTGCPLEEKISEAHMLKRDGDNIGSLALIMIDNPLCPGTGHRICNDCMKGCIYQKVAPVDIPQVETNVLTDVLHMPFGLEMYLLHDALEPVERETPGGTPVQRQESAGGGHGPRRLHTFSLSVERRLCSGRHRRAEDRATAGRAHR